VSCQWNAEVCLLIAHPFPHAAVRCRGCTTPIAYTDCFTLHALYSTYLALGEPQPLV
jgi:hypothetical protein